MHMHVKNCKTVGSIVLQQQCQSLEMPRRMEDRGSVNVTVEKRAEI